MLLKGSRTFGFPAHTDEQEAQLRDYLRYDPKAIVRVMNQLP